MMRSNMSSGIGSVDMEGAEMLADVIQGCEAGSQGSSTVRNERTRGGGEGGRTT
jgi:hypothetical protein